MAKRDAKGAGADEAGGAAADGAAVDGEGEGTKKKGMLLILLPLILVGLGGGGYMAYSQYVALAALGYDSEEAAAEAEGEPTEYGDFLELDNLIINPSGSEGKRYLMIKIGFESDEAKTLEELTEKDVVVRDEILRFLSSKTVDELAAIEQRDQLKQDLREIINGKLTDGMITRLYFTQYVLQ